MRTTDYNSLNFQNGRIWTSALVACLSRFNVVLTAPHVSTVLVAVPNEV